MNRLLPVDIVKDGVGEISNHRKVEAGRTRKWPEEGEDAKAEGHRWHKMAEPGVSGPQVWKDERKNAHSLGRLERPISLENRAVPWADENGCR